MRNLADPDAQLRPVPQAAAARAARWRCTSTRCGDSRLATAVWNAVCWGIIIPAGWRAHARRHALPAPVAQCAPFDGADRFRDRLRDNGFTAVHSETMPGWQRNIVHTFLADAPR